MRAVIVGAGIGGLTTAIALRRAGIEAVVYEQAPELVEVGAGIGLWANAVNTFRSLDLGPAVLALGGGPLGGGIRSLDGRWLTRQPAEVLENRWGAPVIGVRRADLQTVLLGALPADAVRLGARAVRCEQREGRVSVGFQDGGEVAGDVLIGADGLRSVVRSALLGRRPPRYCGYTAWRGVAPPGVRPVVHEASEYWDRGRRFGVLPSRDGLTLWYASANAPEGGVDEGGPQAGLIERFGGWPAPIPTVVASTPPESIVRNDIYDRAPTRRWVVGHIALLGDAAHPMTPDLGQGACQAIVDAEVLADCLASSRDVAGGLIDYRRHRWRAALCATVLARTLGAVGQWEHPIACRARTVALRAMPLRLQLRPLDAVLRR
ncbi:MAG: FAD-dependent monooxygenase [Actinomycetota bacterium]|nr:FAD-dependent monooxygenase [Acidimicrobiia bacterium]MDQ3146298.1 FAD-dependent monooxygenase [Actinomycetota bacterium]